MRVIFMLLLIGSAGSLGQAQSPPPGRSVPRPFTAPRTPWGDPDLQGTFTDKDEMGIPMERPKEFEGRRPDEVTGAELAALIRRRQEQANATAGGIGGGAGNDTGAGPPHWYEHLASKNSRAWMVVDPPDGHLPPLAPGARRPRPFGEERTDSYSDRSLYDRCITRGVTGSMLPVIY